MIDFLVSTSMTFLLIMVMVLWIMLILVAITGVALVFSTPMVFFVLIFSAWINL